MRNMSDHVEAARLPDPRLQAGPLVALAIVTGPAGVLAGRRRDGVPPWAFPGGTVETGETSHRPQPASAGRKPAWRCGSSGDRPRHHPGTGRAACGGVEVLNGVGVGVPERERGRAVLMHWSVGYISYVATLLT